MSIINDEQIDEIYRQSLMYLSKRDLVDIIILLQKERDDLKEELENG